MRVREAMVLRAILFTWTLSLLPVCAHAQTSTRRRREKLASARAGAAPEPPLARAPEPPPAWARARPPALAPGPPRAWARAPPPAPAPEPPRAWARAPPPAPASGPGQIRGWPPEPGAQQGPPQAGLTAKPLARRSIAISAIAFRSRRQRGRASGHVQRRASTARRWSRGAATAAPEFCKNERQVDNFLPKSEDGVRLVPMPGPVPTMSIAMIPARPAVSAWPRGSARSTFGSKHGRVFFSRFGGKWLGTQKWAG